MKQAWADMLKRHDILRTTFCSTDSTQNPFVQVVLEHFVLPWKQEDFKHDKDMLLHEVSESMPPAFDSYRPPYSVTCYSSSHETLLAVDMHHALYDANAMSVLLSEIEQVCKGNKLFAPPSFSDFLDHMVSTDQTKADAWFEETLQGFQPKPFEKQPTAHSVYESINRRLPMKEVEVNGFVKEHALSLLALSQGAWAKTLCLLQTSRDVCFGNVVSGRSVPVQDVERLVAPTLNTVPIRVDTGKARNNLDLIKKLQKLNVEMLPHQLTPLRRIQQKFAAGQRLFDSLVLLQQPPEPLDPSIWTLEGESGEMNVCIESDTVFA